MGLTVRRPPVTCILVLAVAGTLLGAGPSFAAQAATDPLTPAERAWLDDHGPIRYVPGPGYPPFEDFGPDGGFVGIQIDLVKALERELRHPIQVVDVQDWTETLASMRDGRGDLVGALAANEERETYLDFSAPYAWLGVVFYTNQANPDIQDVSDITDQKVGVVTDYAEGAWLRENHPGLNIVEVKNTLDGLEKLELDQIQVFFDTQPVASYYTRLYSISTVRVLGEPAYYSDARFAVPEGETVLLSIIEKGMARVSPAERSSIYVRWTGYDLGSNAGDGLLLGTQTLRNIALGVVAAAVAFSLWNASLRQQVRRRTSELVRSQAELRTVTEAASEGIIASDSVGTITYANSAALMLFGLASNPRGERTIHDLVAPADRALIRALMETRDPAAHRNDAPVEVSGLRPDGSTFPLELSLASVSTPQGPAFSIVVRDITTRKRTEQEQRVAYQREAEIERLKEIDEFKTRFLSTVSHELNTPITPIKLQLHMLRSRESGDLSPRQRRSLSVVDRNLERLANLVQDLLDVSKLQSGHLKLKREPVLLGNLAEDVVESFTEMARDADVIVNLRRDESAFVPVDPARVTQVLFNLLSNALKFTPAGGTIRIDIQTGPDETITRVTDTGPGIKAEQLDRLFQPFTQLHETSRSTHGGSGLGLYICKGIVEQHGGTIWCESEGLGTGASFVFRLPRMVPPTLLVEEAREPTGLPARPLAKPVDLSGLAPDIDPSAEPTTG